MNKKRFAIMLAASFMLMGCTNKEPKTLSCDLDQATEQLSLNASFVVEYDEKEKITNVINEQTIVFADEENLNKYYDLYNDQKDELSSKGASASVTKNELTLKVKTTFDKEALTKNPELMDEESGYEAMKKSLTSEGYTCK